MRWLGLAVKIVQVILVRVGNVVHILDCRSGRLFGLGSGRGIPYGFLSDGGIAGSRSHRGKCRELVSGWVVRNRGRGVDVPRLDVGTPRWRVSGEGNGFGVGKPRKKRPWC
jgi:hypothetical protein